MEDLKVNETPIPEVESTNFVVADIDGHFIRFANLEHVPAGSSVYTSSDDLMELQKDELETLYSKVTGSLKKTFKNKKIAVENVVYHFSKLPVLDPDIVVRGKDAPKSADGKRKYERKSSDEFTVLPLDDKNRPLLNNLAPQARTLYNIMVGSGTTVFTEERLRALIEEKKEQLKTRQDSWRIFKYYQSKLVSSDLLRVK